MKVRGFTLIELLIVVAIMAILVAIAVPNFIEAQIRAKVSRCRVDFRSLATGLEAYAVDWTKYPPGYSVEEAPIGANQFYETLWVLSTPIAYMSTVAYYDPF